MDSTKVSDDVNSLVNTSVEDMTSSLKCAENNKYDSFSSAILKRAYDIVVKRGEKTKARVIKSFYKKAIKFERMVEVNDGNE